MILLFCCFINIYKTKRKFLNIVFYCYKIKKGWNNGITNAQFIGRTVRMYF